MAPWAEPELRLKVSITAVKIITGSTLLTHACHPVAIAFNVLKCALGGGGGGKTSDLSLSKALTAPASPEHSKSSILLEVVRGVTLVL